MGGQTENMGKKGKLEEQRVDTHSYPEWGENAWGNILYFLIDLFSPRAEGRYKDCDMY